MLIRLPLPSTATAVVFAAIFTSSVGAASQTVGEYGAGDRVAFRGCQAISQNDVRWAILHDPQVEVASTPSSPLDEYVSLLGRRTALAYLANGFPVASASARIEGGKILVQIIEVSVTAKQA
jgi:hypothetical protein